MSLIFLMCLEVLYTKGSFFLQRHNGFEINDVTLL